MTAEIAQHDCGGVAPFGWMPEDVVRPRFNLMPWRRRQFAEFMRRAGTEVSWAPIKTYEPAGREPTVDAVKSLDVEWWARLEGELWLLVDRIWFGFPDPLQRSLIIVEKGRLRQLGQFWDIPASWRCIVCHSAKSTAPKDA